MGLVELRNKTKTKWACVAACAVVFASIAWSTPPLPEKQIEAKQLIDARKLASAENLIVAEMKNAPRDADWITLLAEVHRIPARIVGQAVDEIIEVARQRVHER